MSALLLAAAVLLSQCGLGGAHRIHSGEDLATYRILGHPALEALSGLAGQIELIDAAMPCLASAAADDEDALDIVEALAERSARLKPMIKNVRGVERRTFRIFIREMLVR